MNNVVSPCWQSILILLAATCHDWYTDEHVVTFTLLTEQAAILLPGRHPGPINFHVCVLHLKIFHTISSLQNLLGIRSSSATLLCNKGVLAVCIMFITRAGANREAAKAVSTSCENEKRHQSDARTREWHKRQSEEQRSGIRQSDLMGHAERRACACGVVHTWVGQKQKHLNCYIFKCFFSIGQC